VFKLSRSDATYNEAAADAEIPFGRKDTQAWKFTIPPFKFRQTLSFWFDIVQFSGQ